MKVSKTIPGVFAVLGMLLMAAAVLVCVLFRNAQPRMLESPEAASAQAERMMEDLCAGKYGAAAGRMYGQPDLGVEEPADEVTRLVWDAFTDRLSYEFSGVCYVTDTGLARDAVVTALDVSKVMASLPQRAKALLEAGAAAAEDKTEYFDEGNNYREERVTQALIEAVQQALEESETITQNVTLGLIYRDGAWWVVPDQALLKIISGAA